MLNVSFYAVVSVSLVLGTVPAFAQNLRTSGEILPGAGIRFPDGSLQTTASQPSTGTTANAGLYSNTIADFTPPLAYTEVCVKAGAVSFDIHAAEEPTAGGNCLPGDTGWIIERFERDGGATFSWTAARMECLKSGMRIPEPFEWQATCDDNAVYAVSSMDDDWEWASNSVTAVRKDSGTPASSILAPVMGDGGCTRASHGVLARNDGASNLHQLRCAL